MVFREEDLRRATIVCLLAAGSLSASTQIPRTRDGHPDLQGVYDVSTLTPVERPNGVTSSSYTDAEAEKLERENAAWRDFTARPLQQDREPPPKGGDGSTGTAGNVGGDLGVWIEAASGFTVVGRQKRTSIVVDPPSGRVPPMTPEARRRAAAFRGPAAAPHQPAQESDRGFDNTPGAYDDPERRPLGERCLMEFTWTSGAPILPNYTYNNLHQIVQTPEYVVILNEMIHDARIVRMNRQTHLPPSTRQWLADSIGHWEGDTLVVETTNFNDKTRFMGSSQDLHVIERFTRTGPDTLLYRFTVEDAHTWPRPWTGEYTWRATRQRIYEYACHEGNYSLAGILKGARVKEAEEATRKMEPKR